MNKVIHQRQEFRPPFKVRSFQFSSTDITQLSLGWIHHSTTQVGSRGCESFPLKDDCTKLEFSGATTVRLVADWQLPSDTLDSFEQVTEYPQVSMYYVLCAGT